MLPARTTPALLQYFYQFPMSKRRKVEFVTMDISMQFCSVIKTIFPKARIVADRFHMIRLVQWALERAYKAEQKRLCHHSRMVKSNKTILTKPYGKLTKEELITLEGILHFFPRLRCAYALTYAFSKVLFFKDNTNISWALLAWIDLVKSADLPGMNALVTSFTYGYEEIRSALIYPYSNGFTEGCSNKIKALKYHLIWSAQF
ncbi:MAG: transposase [Acidaminococcus sp.]|uniref:transposase n=1 Tax=Acidaminococcus sp. TaxID=1872103 RepID=UPI002A7585BC|nr:transposase [Acidaminococcus sp.]MDY2738449.1 transposase [Acidaminococcus sp.]